MASFGMCLRNILKNTKNFDNCQVPVILFFVYKIKRVFFFPIYKSDTHSRMQTHVRNKVKFPDCSC